MTIIGAQQSSPLKISARTERRGQNNDPTIVVPETKKSECLVTKPQSLFTDHRSLNFSAITVTISPISNILCSLCRNITFILKFNL